MASKEFSRLQSPAGSVGGV